MAWISTCETCGEKTICKRDTTTHRALCTSCRREEELSEEHQEETSEVSNTDRAESLKRLREMEYQEVIQKDNQKYKYVFLDIDGVINTPKNWKTDDELDRGCVEHLNDLVCPEVRWICSSTWRMGKTPEQLTKILQDHGFKGEIFANTPILWGTHRAFVRGNEIAMWLDDNLGHHKLMDYYVILDDDSDMLYTQRHNFICIDGFVGVTPKTTFLMRKILRMKRVDE